METESIQSTSCRSERSTPSSRKQSRKTKKLISKRRTRTWKSDAEYIADQDSDSTWSTFDTAWGNAASLKFVKFGTLLEEMGKLCHDDKVADFGGNDGRSSYCFYQQHKIKPLVVDCEPKRLEYARTYYGLKTYQSFIENMSELKDKSIDWGFCSHTLEHTRDTTKAMREISRVVSGACYFVVPLEDLAHARRNHAHAICFRRVEDWKKLLEENGWKIRNYGKVSDFEAQIFAEPV